MEKISYLCTIMHRKGLTKKQLYSRLLSGAVWVLICIIMISDSFQWKHHSSGYLAIGYLVVVLAWIGYAIWQYRHHPVVDPAVDEMVTESLKKRAAALALIGGGTLLYLLLRWLHV